MDWIEVTVHTTTEGSELVSDLLIRTGADGTMTEDRADIPDPSKPNGFWEIIDPHMIDAMPEDVVVHAWFQPDAQFGDRMSGLRGALDALRVKGGAPLGTLELDTAEVHDEDWAEVWKRFYKPFRAGERLVVKPTWEPYEPEENDLVIEMDPGMAFGSGTHETTGLCLALLEKAVKPGATVIDVGTGSGILAIGAAKLGAKRVLAVDIDPQAVRVAAENIAHNGFSDRITAVQGDLLERQDLVADVCVANIIADVIIGFAAPLRAHILPGGQFICSGIIREREQDVLDALKAANYEILDLCHRGEWVAMRCRRT